MRFIHTADWHLGKSLRGFSLIDDQSHVLDEFLRLASDVKPDAVVIAGDIYDRAVPPTDAVKLMDETLTKLVVEKKIKTIAVAGNHDSAGRINFGSRLMEDAGLFVRGELTDDMSPVVLEDEYGRIFFSPLPYVEPIEAQHIFACEERLDFDAANAAAIKKARAHIPQKARSVAVAHVFIAGGTTSESERLLSVGGAANVSARHFADYSYAALGHLHAPQRAGADNIRYSGSLLKYSFDEAQQKKGVTLVEIDGSGAARHEHVSLAPKRDVRIVRGFIDEIRNDREKYPLSDDYVTVELLDTKAILNAYDKLAAVYKNLCGVSFAEMFSAKTNVEARKNFREKSETELFADFYFEMTNEKMSDRQKNIFGECVDRIYREAREET